MAKLGIVSDEQFAKEVADCVSDTITPPDLSASIIEQATRGRSKGDNNVPDGLRKIIADEHLTQGRQAALDLASEFGISASSVSAYAKGATSTASYNDPNKILQNYLTARKAKLNKKALKVLQSSLDTITPEKLQSVKAKDLASIARDMSVISKNMEPESTPGAGADKPQFVVYAPQVRDERSYDTIVVSDNY